MDGILFAKVQAIGIAIIATTCYERENIMLNANAKANSKLPNSIIDDDFLAIITTLFVEGQAIDQSLASHPHNPIHRSGQWEKREALLELPSNSVSVKAADISKINVSKEEPANCRRESHHDDIHCTIRTFILGLSDAFNNLLMGIWGNLSLINLSIDASNPVFEIVSRMELLIHDGATLINGVFGYLGERRVIAKKIRLNQLLQEINECIPVDGQRVKREIMKATRLSSSGPNYSTLISGSLARMLEQLMERVQKNYDQIVQKKSSITGLGKRLSTIDRLMHKAWDIIHQLYLYAGNGTLKKKRVSLRAIVKKETRLFSKKFPNINASIKMANRLPMILADQSMLRLVLKQLMENAANAMEGHGDLHIDIRVLGAEAPHERCVAVRWINSVVVTITDRGRGMDHQTLFRIFDPFFTGQRNSKRLGMGLATTSSIVKAHDGYLHVRSIMGRGSSFKIYLPIS